ncbi:MAG TPA: hypothetical protein VGE68_10445 [Sphingomicrobium sp.]|nr:hypothetical protein [Sphingomicrobium sp.]
MRWMPALAVLAIAACLLWPAVVNGDPFYHPDTPSYFRAAASAVFKALGIKTQWVEAYLRVYAPQTGTPSISSPGAPRELPVTLSGRSSYYGIFLYLAYLVCSVWIAAIVQSVITATSIWLTITLLGRATGRMPSPRMSFLIALATALLTPAAYFSDYLMPDLFAGIGLLAACNLLFLWSLMTRGEKIYWAAALAYSVLAHSTNLMLFTALLVLALAYRSLRRMPFNPAQVSTVFLCLCCGFVGQLAFSQTVKHLTGAQPVRPPFVAMRLIADGPGYAFLRDHCGTEKYIYCRVLGRTNLASDILLWAKDPKDSLFRGLSPAEQRISAGEQRKFIIAVTLDRPFDVIGSGLRNTFHQLVAFKLDSFNYVRSNKDRYEETVPPALLRSIEHTRAYQRTMPTRPTELVTALATCLSVLLLSFLFIRRSRPSARITGYVLAILAGVLINAAICGALSGPKGRYEMRLIWVLPVIAAVLAYNRRTFASEVQGGRETARDDDPLLARGVSATEPVAQAGS